MTVTPGGVMVKSTPEHTPLGYSYSFILFIVIKHTLPGDHITVLYGWNAATTYTLPLFAPVIAESRLLQDGHSLT